MYLWWGDHAEFYLFWFDLYNFSKTCREIYLSEKKKKEEKRFIRILRLTYGVTFVAFRDLGGGGGVGGGVTRGGLTLRGPSAR